MIEKAQCTLCTLCAAEPSPQFYTGCIIADGHGGNGWKCDGKGNLTRDTDDCAVAPKVNYSKFHHQAYKNKLEFCQLGITKYPRQQTDLD